MEKGWIKLFRSIRGNWIWEVDEKFDKRSAWIDILLSANHKPKKINLGNELVTIDEGEFITSQVKLAEKWGWSRTKVRNFLNLLESDKMIKKQVINNKRTHIKVCNYKDYQRLENSKKTGEVQEENRLETGQKHQGNRSSTSQKHRKNTNKNVKNVKNVKNDKEEQNKAVPHSDYSEVYNYAIQKIKAKDIAKSYLIKQDLQSHSIQLLKKAVDLAVAAKEDREEYSGGNPKAGVNITSYKYIRCFLQEAEEIINGGGSSGTDKNNRSSSKGPGDAKKYTNY